MTAYRVVIAERARRDMIEAYEWAARHAPVTALRWLKQFEGEIRSLAIQPQRHAKAPENRFVPEEVYHFIYGRRSNKFRVLFVINGETVYVFRVLRAQRRPLTRRQLDDVLPPNDD